MTDGHLFNNVSLGGEDGTDEDFVADKDDGRSSTVDSECGSSTVESGEEDSNAFKSGGEKEGKSYYASRYYVSKLNELRAEMDNEFAYVHNEFAYVHSEFACINAKVDRLTELICKRVSQVRDFKNIKKRDFGRALGEKGKKMSAEEREPHEVKARADKKRYRDEVSGCKIPKPMVYSHEPDTA